VNKAELVARVARDTGLTKADVLRVIDAVIDAVGRSLRRGGTVKLVGFGTFHVGRHKARAGHNPRTQEPMRITARKLPKFTPGKDLKKLVR
jgi:DNA-binding protein HU-beta